MHKLGTILAFIFNKVFILALVVLFAVAVPVMGVTSTVTDREAIKSILADADVYNTIPDNILEIITIEGTAEERMCSRNDGRIECDAETDATEYDKTVRQALVDNGLINPDELTAAIKNIFDAEFLQTQAEAVIDGLYDFASSDNLATELIFEITLSDRADTAVSEIRSFVATNLDNIPTCTDVDQLPDNEEDLDLLDISCLPPGNDLEVEIDKFIAELEAEDGILRESFSSEDLDISEADLVGAQVAYRAASSVPIVFIIASIALSFAVILTSKSLHRGFKEVGIILAIFGLLFTVAYGSLADQVVTQEDLVGVAGDDLSPAQEEAVLRIVTPVAEEIVSTVSGKVLPVSITMLFLGIMSFGFGVYLTRHHVEHLRLHHQPAPEDEKPEDKPEDPPAEKPEPKKPAAKKSPTKKAPAKKSAKKVQ